MVRHRPSPDDFISLLSSEDEAPLTRKRRYSSEETASGGGKRASKGRVKRARATSASGDGVGRPKASQEEELHDDEGLEIGVPGVGTPGGKKKAERFSPDTAFMPKVPPTFTFESITLQLPVFSRQREGTWLTRFTDWARLLCTTNMASPSAAELTPALIRVAYKQYIDIHSRLKSNKKRAARLVAQQFKDASLLDMIGASKPVQSEAVQVTVAVGETSEGTSAEPQQLSDESRPLALPPQTQLLSAAAAPHSLSAEHSDLYMIDVDPRLPQTGTLPVSQPSQPKQLRQTLHSSTTVIMSAQAAPPSGAEALRQQRLYFPSAKDPSTMCLSCGAEGHIADKCTLSCQLCGKQGHWGGCCPSKKICCGNCNRLGHLEEACRNPKDAHWVLCVFCRSPDHYKNECMTLYRSFRPGPDTIKKVNALAVSCAACGSETHFHGNCRKDGEAPLPYDSKFHLDNMRRYLDPTSSTGPIIGTDACRKSSKVGGYTVCGGAWASPDVHYYSGSDDSDEGLRVPITSPTPLRRYNCVPPPACLQSASSASHQSPPTRETSPSIGSVSSRASSPYRPSWARPVRSSLTPEPINTVPWGLAMALAEQRRHLRPGRGGGRGSGRGGRGGRGGGRGRQSDHAVQNGQATQDAKVHQEEDVEGGQDAQSGQGEKNGKARRRGSGKRDKRGGQNGQGGHREGADAPQEGPTTQAAQAAQGGRVGQGEQSGTGEQTGQGKRRNRRRQGVQHGQDAHQEGPNAQVAPGAPGDQGGQDGQNSLGEQTGPAKRGKRRGRGGRGGQHRQPVTTEW